MKIIALPHSARFHPLAEWVRGSDCQCQSHQDLGFNPGLPSYSGIWGAADEAALKLVECSMYTYKIPNTSLLSFSLSNKTFFLALLPRLHSSFFIFSCTLSLSEGPQYLAYYSSFCFFSSLLADLFTNFRRLTIFFRNWRILKQYNRYWNMFSFWYCVAYGSEEMAEFETAQMMDTPTEVCLE